MSEYSAEAQVRWSPAKRNESVVLVAWIWTYLGLCTNEGWSKKRAVRPEFFRIPGGYSK